MTAQPRLRPLVRRALWTAVITINLILVVITIAGLFVSVPNFDWTYFYVPAAHNVFAGGLYDPSSPTQVFRYSPVAAYLFAGLLPLGAVGWSLLHAAALVPLGKRLAALTLVSWPFWADVYNGNVTTFVFVAAMAALRGSRIGAWSFFALAVMVPRPMAIPVVVWLLWKRRETRWPFVAIFVFHALLVVASGWEVPWLESFARAGDDIGHWPDLGPARLLGTAWIPLGIAATAWLTARGRLGLASLAASPYWLSHYLLMLLLEIVDTGVGRLRIPERLTSAGTASRKVAS